MADQSLADGPTNTSYIEFKSVKTQHNSLAQHTINYTPQEQEHQQHDV